MFDPCVEKNKIPTHSWFYIGFSTIGRSDAKWQQRSLLLLCPFAYRSRGEKLKWIQPPWSGLDWKTHPLSHTSGNVEGEIVKWNAWIDRFSQTFIGSCVTTRLCSLFQSLPRSRTSGTVSMRNGVIKRSSASSIPSHTYSHLGRQLHDEEKQDAATC